MDLNKEIIDALYKARASKEYFNPFFVPDILTALRDYDPVSTGYEKEIEELFDWCDDLWQR